MEAKFIEVINKYVQEDFTETLKNEDLKELGLDSMGSIELLLELEEAFNISFPDELLTEDTFSSASKLWESINELNKGELYQAN
jgi:acyl carrier protein